MPYVTARLRERAPALLLHASLPLDAEEVDLLRRRYGHRGGEAMLRDLMRGLASISQTVPLVLCSRTCTGAIAPPSIC